MNPNLLSVFPIKKQELLRNMLWTSVYTNTNTNNINETWALLQTTGGKDEPNIVLFGNRNGHHNTELRVHTDVQSILRCVCFSSSSCILRIQCCQFLWIVNSWLPLRYSLTFICSVYYVPNVASFSGMSILDYPFGIL
jgi:hypothetical protein